MEKVPFVLPIGWIQLIRIYKTHSKYFLVGSNKEESRFKIIKIDREQPFDLVVEQSGTEYDLNEISKIIAALHAGNSGKSTSKFWTRGLVQSLTAFGLVGFVRFLEGYYMVLITKRAKLAELGGHSIYKIEGSSMIYIPNSTVRVFNPEESRYLKSFQTVDLSSNFYFSYSYDLSNTLQHSICMLNSSSILKQPDCETTKDSVSCSSTSTVESWDEVAAEELTNGHYFIKSKKLRQFAVKIEPAKKFIWNHFLLQPATDQNISSDWFVNIIHGFIRQVHIDVYGKPIYITLIARRSNLYAGTRFLKRGCNVKGDVANEVETEQIVHSATVTSFEHGQYTAYVQHRGSVPVYWYQDINANVVPAKPQIHIASSTPYAHAPSKHFNMLFKRFGSPIVVLNLVRRRERKQHESLLGTAFKSVVEYLNMFLPLEKQIHYLPVDMAQLSRSEKTDVLAKLDKISLDTIYKTGFFQTQVKLFSDTLTRSKSWNTLGGCVVENLRLQAGVLRTNCVDCLDRTNSAQFVAAKCVLGFQLYSLGIIPEPKVEFDTPAMQVFEELFEEHGDIIALQYGGSQLVHTIQSYRKTEVAIAAHSRDIVTTLSRYYSNTFSDSDKQSAINLFLGVFQPSLQPEHQWDILTDMYLHNDITSVLKTFDSSNYRLWCEPYVQICLPIPADFITDGQRFLTESSHKNLKVEPEENDWFTECYNVTTLTSFDDLFGINIISSTSQLSDNSTSESSPFAVSSNTQSMKQYANITNSISSQSSLDSSSSSNDGDEETSSDNLEKSFNLKYSNLQNKSFSVNNNSSDSCYGSLCDYQPSRKDINIYKRHVKVQDIHENYIPLSVFSQDSSFSIEPPTVDKRSRIIYEKSVLCCSEYPTKLLSNIEDYKKYVGLPH